MNTEYSRARNCWQAMMIVAAVLGACGPVQEGPGNEEGVEVVEQEALAGVSLGFVTGNIFTGVEQPMSSHSEQVFCEYSNMGAKWIRIEAGLPGVDVDTYQRIVEKARAKGIKVLVMLPARYCAADSSSEPTAFTTAYVNQLNELATTVFTGTAAADAYEIGNEPNVKDCSDPAFYRVAPNAFAWLLRRVWDWKQTNGRPELIVSGGIRNVYVTSSASSTEPYWNALFASPAFNNGGTKIRPFDYLGVHPYNNNNMDYTCINAGYTTCFVGWKSKVTTGLKSAASRMNTATGTTDTKLFATEFGFQVSPTDICSGIENCTLKYSVPEGSAPYQQLAAAMNAAGEAFVNSGVTPLALWNHYRDDANGTFGLRGEWDATTNKYLVKPAGWNKFRSLAGGTGSTNPEACWAVGEYIPVDFEYGDDRRSTASGEWAYASWKGECAPGERIMGLSKSIANGWASVGLCYKDPLDSGRYKNPAPGETPTCTVRDVSAGDARGAVPTTTLDWDAGNWRAECAPNEYVAGVAQTTSHELSHVLCCPATVSATSCEVVSFGNGDNRQATSSGNWDADGYKGECGVGRYVAGVSRTPAGEPSSLLCCYQ